MRNSPTSWTQERIDTMTKLAGQGLTSREISERIGVSRSAVIGKLSRIGVSLTEKRNAHTLMTEQGRARALAELRKHAAAGMLTGAIAEKMGLDRRAIREFALKHGIKLLHRLPAAPKPPKKPRTVKNAPVRGTATTVAEWIARNGPPPKFEAGTLDQILHDTFHAVGKRFQRTSGNGSSWKPYLINGKAVSAVDAIRKANEIREAMGKPLLSEPRRRAA